MDGVAGDMIGHIFKSRHASHWFLSIVVVVRLQILKAIKTYRNYQI